MLPAQENWVKSSLTQEPVDKKCLKKIMINCCRKIFLLILLIFLFWHETASAIEVQCEYIPRDSSGNILYYEGTDADHRPWSKKIEEAECLAKCNRESVTNLMSDCESWRGPFQNPDGCDVSRTSCGPVINPFLTVNCKFTPRNPAGSALDDAWEILTLSESDCQNLCADSMVLCSTLCGTVMDDRCCDGTKTTCEATNIAADISSSSTPHQFDSVTPELQIPLPTLPSFSEFTDLTLQGEAPNRYLWIPWIGQYIAAIYKYAIGIVGVLAGIMIVVGGLLWLTAGGSAERVSTAKSFVESSLVGLVIALTSYLLLYVINPNLVGFESLKVKYIEREVDTLAFSLAAASDTSVPEGSRPVATSEQCDETLARCPLTFTSPLDSGTGPGNPRALEFMEKMKSSLSGTTRSKVMTAATAAANCCVVLGSCGESNLKINKLAGVPEAVPSGYKETLRPSSPRAINAR